MITIRNHQKVQIKIMGYPKKQVALIMHGIYKLTKNILIMISSILILNKIDKKFLIMFN
jgi:hypothetical protein